MIGVGSSNILGIALTDRAMACTELSVRGDRRTLRKAAVFALPLEVSLDNPEKLGRALRDFLKSNGFAASRTVVGVPARWLIAVDRELPPADETQARAMLRLQAERLAVGENGELIFDYAGAAAEPDKESGKILLVGILKKQLERIQSTMETAGLNVIAVTSSALNLAQFIATTETSAPNVPVIVLGRHGAEVVFHKAGTARMLRHVSSSSTDGHGAPAIAPLGAELRRTVTLAGATMNGKPVPPGGRELLFWDSVGLTNGERDELSEKLGFRLRSGSVQSTLRVEAREADGPLDEQLAPALSLAVAGSNRAGVPLDFANSRLAPVPVRKIGTRTIIAAIVTLLVVGSIVALMLDASARESELEAATAQLAQMQPDIERAQTTLDRANFGRGFFTTRPPMLDCMREVTLALREDDPIWVTSITLRENGNGTIVGKSTSERTILAVFDRLRANENFRDVGVVDMKKGGGSSNDIAFTLSFTFGRPVKSNTPTTTSPATHTTVERDRGK